jgi:hypothetical protein
MRSISRSQAARSDDAVDFASQVALGLSRPYSARSPAWPSCSSFSAVSAIAQAPMERATPFSVWVANVQCVRVTGLAPSLVDLGPQLGPEQPQQLLSSSRLPMV